MNRSKAAFTVQVLVSKLAQKYTTSSSNGKRGDIRSYSILNKKGDWSSIDFKFTDDEKNVSYSIVVEDEDRTKLINISIKTTSDNKHHTKLIDQGYTDMVNRLYKLLNQENEIGFNQLKPVFEHIKQLDKYISHDNELLQKSNS